MAGTTRARLYRVYHRGDRAHRLVACNLSSGRRTLLARELPRDDRHGITQTRFAGRFAAVAISACTGEHCKWSVRIADLETGRVRRSAGSLGGTVSDLVLAPTGSFAWIADGMVTICGPRFCNGHGFVKRRTLALSPGGRLYWVTFDNQLGTAPID